MAKTWFITGASKGFGRELTERLLARGDRVAATLRQPDVLAALKSQYGDRLWVAALDVTDTAAQGKIRGFKMPEATTAPTAPSLPTETAATAPETTQ